MSTGTAADSLEFCSLDYWDYFVELECLQNSKGKDLQLAAELGKTLLERNKELETGLKQQQTVIEDQSQEIEYLSKQSGALREVNDSRLRVYEQLEVSIQELEVTNQRLTTETGHDKKRIRSLTQTVECLEARVAELQALVDELQAAERERRRLAAAVTPDPTDDRSDCAHQSRAEDLADRVAVLERQLSESRDRETAERQRRRAAEAELSTAQQESLEVQQEMAVLRERSVKLHSLAEEVHALEEHRLSPFLRHCSPRVCSASPQMSAPSPQLLEGAAASTTGGSVAPSNSVWGPQSVVWPAEAAVSSPAPDSTEGLNDGRLSPAQHSLAAAGGVPLSSAQHGSAPASLISDLDAHYRVLLDEMDKYEWMLSARQPPALTPQQPSSLSLLQELQMSTGDARSPSGGQLRISSLEAAQVPLRDSGPDSLMLLAAASDGDASSSGFSEGSSDSRTVSRATQTPEHAAVPTAMANVMMASGVQTLVSPPPQDMTVTSSSGRVQPVPQYKQLFQEIFEVLKKPPLVCAGALTSVGRSSSPSPRPTAAGVRAEVVDAAKLDLAASSLLTPMRGSSPVWSGAAVAADDVTAETPAHHTRSFSYTQEFEKCLQKASAEAAASPIHTARKGGAGDAALGTAPAAAEPVEEFPHLARPSEEVAKLWILERSYAEALKAGRRCLNRPTML